MAHVPVDDQEGSTKDWMTSQKRGFTQLFSVYLIEMKGMGGSCKCKIVTFRQHHINAPQDLTSRKD